MNLVTVKCLGIWGQHHGRVSRGPSPSVGEGSLLTRNFESFCRELPILRLKTLKSMLISLAPSRGTADPLSGLSGAATAGIRLTLHSERALTILAMYENNLVVCGVWMLNYSRSTIEEFQSIWMIFNSTEMASLGIV